MITLPHCSMNCQPRLTTLNISQVSKIISMLHDGKSPGAGELHPEVKREGWKLVEFLYAIIRNAWKNLEGCSTSLHLQEG